MRNLKKVGLFFASLLVVISFVGCSAEWKSSDAVDYVRSSLNAFTKGDMKKYAEITKQTEKEAKSEYEDGMNEMLKSFEGPGVTEAAKSELKTVIIDLLKVTKYDVKSAEKTKKGFDVKLAIKPFVGFDNLESELQKQITPEAIDKSGVDLTNETAINEWAMGLTIDFMKQAVKNPTYGTEKEMIIKINKQNKVYNISDSDLEKVVIFMLSGK